jgi:hypothetical protein
VLCVSFATKAASEARPGDLPWGPTAQVGSWANFEVATARTTLYIETITGDRCCVRGPTPATDTNEPGSQDMPTDTGDDPSEVEDSHRQLGLIGIQGVRYWDSFLRTLCAESSARTLSGRQAFCSSDLITQIHGILPAYDDLRAGPRSLGVDQAADPSPYVPLRELRRVGPPVWDIFV